MSFFSKLTAHGTSLELALANSSQCAPSSEMHTWSPLCRPCASTPIAAGPWKLTRSWPFERRRMGFCSEATMESVRLDEEKGHISVTTAVM